MKAYPSRGNAPAKKKSEPGRKRGRGKVANMAARKASKSAPARSRAAKPAKLSIDERLAALEAWALQSGAHLPHLYDTQEPAGAV